jgi:hypothetical protein
MAFKNERQRAAVCRAVLHWRGIERYWKGGASISPGPTEEGCRELRAVKERTSSLSHGEGILLAVAFDVWNGVGQCTLWNMSVWLSEDQLHAVGELLIAMSARDKGEKIGAWIAVWGPAEEPA